METKDYLSRQTSILRLVCVGAAAYGSWVLFNLLIVPLIPLLLLLELVSTKRRAENRREVPSWPRRFLLAALRFFLFRQLVLCGIYRIEEWPDLTRAKELGSVVLVANHRSWFDAMFLFCLFPGAQIPVNAKYLRIPVVGTLARMIGVIPLDRSSAASAHACALETAAALGAGGSLVLCPEGTRAKIGPMRPFTNIFFRVALDAKTPIVPIVVQSDIPCMGPGPNGKTVLVPWRRAVFRLRALDPIFPEKNERPADLSRQAHKQISKVLLELDEQVARKER